MNYLSISNIYKTNWPCQSGYYAIMAKNNLGNFSSFSRENSEGIVPKSSGQDKPKTRKNMFISIESAQIRKSNYTLSSNNGYFTEISNIFNYLKLIWCFTGNNVKNQLVRVYYYLWYKIPLSSIGTYRSIIFPIFVYLCVMCYVNVTCYQLWPQSNVGSCGFSERNPLLNVVLPK